MKFFFLLFILGFIFIISYLDVLDKIDITDKWATKKGKVVSKKLHVTNLFTPFYYIHAGGFIIEYDIEVGAYIEKWFVRIDIWGNEYIRDDSNGNAH